MAGGEAGWVIEWVEDGAGISREVDKREQTSRWRMGSNSIVSIEPEKADEAVLTLEGAGF